MRQPKPEHEPLVDEIIHRLRGSKRTLAVGHVNADPDAIGAAIALAESFPNVTVGAFTSLNKSAVRLSSTLGHKVVIDPDLRSFETVVVCDATSASQLNAKDPRDFANAIFMDHHQPSNFAGARLYWSDARFRATCEMALYLLRRAGVPISRNAKVALLAGLLTDTGRFKYNDEEVFGSVAALLSGGPEGPTPAGTYQFARQLVEESERDPSEITAQLKGLQRAQWKRVGPWFLAWTFVSAFESNLSSLLVSSGADVAVAFKVDGLSMRGSSRATRGAEQAGLNLGALWRDFKPVQWGASWDGGGHAAAAGFTADAERSSLVVPPSALTPNCAEMMAKEALEALEAVLAKLHPKEGASAPPWDASRM